MNDSDLKFDRSCHALYTKQCKQQILEKIALHYPEKQRAGVWDSVQQQFVEFLSDWRTDLGGLYPTGEGAGWAGGIMSAAVDGIRQAQRILGIDE